jgi:CheY-like chemotaxis protein
VIGASPLSGLRLLVVEDEAMVAMMLEDMLSDLGCVVAGSAGNITRGLAFAEDDDFALDAAVLDINLGGEKVFPVAERLVIRGVPFVFATGYGRDGVTEAFARAPVLSKPFDHRALEAALISALQPRQG